MNQPAVSQTVSQPRLERRPNLAYYFQELFTAIVRVRANLQIVPNADAFRANAKELIRVAYEEAAARGYTSADVKMAAFAVVAFLDESVLTSRSPAFATWSRSTLQQELFHEHMAGEKFFEDVQTLLSRRDSADAIDVLEVYYLSMLLGYRGRYGSSGDGELRAIMESIRSKTNRVRGNSPLSPASALPGDPALPKQRDPWLRRLTWTTAAAALLALVTFVGSEVMLSSGNSAAKSAADQVK